MVTSILGYPLFDIHGLSKYGLRENYKNNLEWKYPFPGIINQYKTINKELFVNVCNRFGTYDHIQTEITNI